MDRRELKRDYKESPRKAGVFLVRNTLTGKVLIGSSRNLDGILNRHEFQLRANGHPNRPLQLDWNAQSGEGFEFSVVEELVERENLDHKRELEFLEDLWIENLGCIEPVGYNQPKMTREERLRMIAARNADANYRK